MFSPTLQDQNMFLIKLKMNTVGMTVVPMDIKEGMGVGTTFRVIGDFSGKRLEWDCETTDFIRNEKINCQTN